MARRNRRVEPDWVRLSGPLAHGAAHRVAHWMANRMADRRRRAGKRAGSRLFLRLLLFAGASAGRGRRTSGVDGADIGHRIDRVKANYRKKGNIFRHRPATSLPLPPRTERSGDPGACPDRSRRVQESRAKAVPGGPGPRIKSGAAIAGVCRRSAKPGVRGRLWSPDRPCGPSGAARMEGRAGLRCPPCGFS